MIAAYRHMHALGHAHSFEVFAHGQLVGGIYGIAVGRMFFGESMFSAQSGGSKVALAALARHLHGWGCPVIDAQVENEHLMSLGAERWPRRQFLEAVEGLRDQPGLAGSWTERVGDWPASRLAGTTPA
jgi:leucyl/phenylalanyl-tRNA--protein transferase